MTRHYIAAAAIFAVASLLALRADARTGGRAVVHNRLDALIDSTVENTYNYRFGHALEFTDSMMAEYPKMPEGYVYRCGIYSKMIAEDCFRSPDSIWNVYHVIVDKACSLSKKRVESAPDNVHRLFYYASALVYRSRYEAAKSDWFGLMADGLKSRKILEKAVKLDPHFYDAYSGIGAFNYYAAHLPWYLKPMALILGINGNEKLGIEELKKAAERGSYSKAEAASFLADIVDVDKKNYSGIVKRALSLHRMYPGNLDFVRSLCFGYYRLHEYDKVLRFANPCLADYRGADSLRFVSLSYIRFYRGEAYAALRRNYGEAIADLSKIIEMGKPSVLLSRAYYGRGSVYERMGEEDKAILDFKTAIKLNGDYNACRQARIALDSLQSP